MRITDNVEVGGAAFQKPDKSKEKAAEAKSGEVISKNDQINLSDTAKEIGRLQVSVSKLPDIRPDKVTDVKSAINSGTYDVKGDAVAGKLLKNAIIDKLI